VYPLWIFPKKLNWGGGHDKQHGSGGWIAVLDHAVALMEMRVLESFAELPRDCKIRDRDPVLGPSAWSWELWGSPGTLGTTGQSACGKAGRPTATHTAV
jgi:hypothetical protein